MLKAKSYKNDKIVKAIFIIILTGFFLPFIFGENSINGFINFIDF